MTTLQTKTRYTLILSNTFGELDRQTVEVPGDPRDVDDPHHDQKAAQAMGEALASWTLRNADTIRIKIEE